MTQLCADATTELRSDAPACILSDMAKKPVRQFRFSHEADNALAAVALFDGVTRTQVIERLVIAEARRVLPSAGLVSQQPDFQKTLDSKVRVCESCLLPYDGRHSHICPNGGRHTAASSPELSGSDRETLRDWDAQFSGPLNPEEAEPGEVPEGLREAVSAAVCPKPTSPEPTQAQEAPKEATFILASIRSNERKEK